LWIGHGLFIGLIGLDGISAPFYVSRWFDRRRGSALALMSSGTYVAGAKGNTKSHAQHFPPADAPTLSLALGG
jgi:hypothetical protein